MAVLDKPLRKAAKVLLKRFGAPVTVKLIDKAGEYNTAQGREPKTTTTVSTYALDTAAVEKGFGQTQGSLGSHPGSVRRRVKWLVPAIDFPVRAPRSNDTITRAGTEHRIVSVLPYETGELAGLYELEIAR